MNDDVVVDPLDGHQKRLLSHVRPDGWRNPDPASLYDLVVIGGGTGGLVCAVGAAGLGARVALVERAWLGGDCLHTGCVPSKTLLRAARAVQQARSAASAGIRITPQIDFAAVIEAVHARRADLARHDSAARLTSLGVDVFFGDASFADTRTVTVAGSALRFRRAVIATGGRPSIPPISGLTGIRFLTTDNLFSRIDQPRSLLVIGGGPVGCEMAQAFAVLGTAVTIVEAGPRILPHEDAEASEVLQRQLCLDGVRIITAAAIDEIAARQGIAGTRARFNDGEIDVDAVLVATGRTPNVDGLNLKAAGVDYDAHGVGVDEWLRTSNHRIYAAGDVCSRFNFTHAADAMARIVVQNALFPFRRRASALVIPWATYTFPEVAHVGLLPVDAVRSGGGRTRLQPVSVEDVAEAVANIIADPGTVGRTYELGGPGVYTLRELVMMTLQLTGKRRLLIAVPFAVAKIQARLFELLPNPPLTTGQVDLLKADNIASGTLPGLQELKIQTKS